MTFETLKVNRDGAVLFVKMLAPPMNLLGPELVRDLVTLIQDAEADDGTNVLVFSSADPDFFISHVDVTKVKEYRDEAAKLTGEPSIALLFRHLSASRLVSIAQIEGRVRGAGSEFVLACDMRFAARESAVFSQMQPAFGLIPGGGAAQFLTRLMGRGRALEVMLGALDYDADIAERYGWINRALPAESLVSPRFESVRRKRADAASATPDGSRHGARVPDARSGTGPRPDAWRTRRLMTRSAFMFQKRQSTSQVQVQTILASAQRA
jgi:enoyl-CoA hydratase/carnithine racemase